MDFLILWLGTTIASFYMEIVNELRMFKDAADEGYKIDTKKLDYIGKQLNPNATKITLFQLLIPIINIMSVFQRAITYNNIRPMVLDQLSAIDVLEKMTDIEKEEYQKKPTGLNALIVPIKADMRLSNAHSIKINSEIEKSEIFFELGKNFSDITILKVTGAASRLTVEQQKQKVIESLKTLAKSEIKEYNDNENLLNNLNNSHNIELSSSPKTNTQQVQQLNNSQFTKEELENLKNVLLEEQKLKSQSINDEAQKAKKMRR